MYILNTSFHITERHTDRFMSWARETYIPAALATGHLSDPLFTRLLTVVEPGTVSFAIHFHCRSLHEAEQWHDNEASLLKAAFHKELQGELVYFSTFMEKVGTL
ncbi:MAG: DUF4286 family protein [Muribaculaceae bacterium]|nr:DUF4286 family protein [Muribaculaceae bacterium]